MDQRNNSLTIGIPTYNCFFDQLKKTIDSICKSIHYGNYHNYEIIICINGKPNKEINILLDYYSNISVIHTHRYQKSKALAINLIKQYAKNENLIIVDDDVLINHKCIKLLVKNIQKPNILLSYPSRKLILIEKSLSITYILWKIFNVQYQKNLFKNGDKYFTGMCFCVKKNYLPKLPKDLINDDQFLHIYFMKKCKLINNAIVYYHGVSKYGDFKMRYFRINQGRLQIKKYFDYLIINEYQSDYQRKIDYLKSLRLSSEDFLFFLLYRILYKYTKYLFNKKLPKKLVWDRTS